MRKKTRGSANNLSRLKLSMMFGYTAVIIAIITLISALVLNKTDDVLKSKVSSMTGALNVQMKMNMNSYLAKLETTGTLIFASKEVYTYSASDENADSYEAINTEDIISDELYNLCIMENFVDFGIVYDNNHVVGKISNGTINLFGDNIYTDLAAMINRKKTNDGWSAGYNGDFRRIYYVKRVNEHAVFVSSFYTAELGEVFEHPGGIDDITVRLTDSENSVIYSSEDDETGKSLPDDINERINSQTSVTIMDEEYLITVNSCGDNWKVICSVPTQIILKEKNEVQFYIILVAVVASIIALAVSAALSQMISDPVDNMLGQLAKKASIDQLTQIFNKKTFEDLVCGKLERAQESDRFCMMIIDIDDFKSVNDTHGHAAGDKVLADVGGTLRRSFKNDAYVGRLGGDEFCAFMEIPKRILNDTEFISSKCARLCESLRGISADEDGKHKISVSIGAVSSTIDGKEFADFYANADKALYAAKKKGKDTFSLYGAEDKK